MDCCIILTGATAFSNARFGAGNGSIFLDNVGCAGIELFLFNCSNGGIGIHNCVHSEDASVRCIDSDIGEANDSYS